MPSGSATKRTLIATMTNEPFQPVRLYYAIPGRAPVTARLRELECVVEAPAERCWQWLFHGVRALRALEHWNGNTHLTLTAIIVRTVEQSMQARDQQGQQK